MAAKKPKPKYTGKYFEVIWNEVIIGYAAKSKNALGKCIRGTRAWNIVGIESIVIKEIEENDAKAAKGFREFKNGRYKLNKGGYYYLGQMNLKRDYPQNPNWVKPESVLNIR